MSQNANDLGSTGKFPAGKVGPHDEGELLFAVGSGNGLVWIDFGKQVKWLAFDPPKARLIAATLLDRADLAEKGDG